MLKIIKIGYFTFKEGLREKIFIGTAILLALTGILSLYLKELSAGDEIRILRDFSGAATEVLSLFIILFIVTQNFYRWRYTKFIDILMSRFRRKDILLGVASGYFMLIALFIISAYFMFSLILCIYGGYYTGFIWGGYFSLLKLTIITSFCVFSSVFFDAPIISFLSTLFFYIGSELSYSAVTIASQQKETWQSFIINIIYRILPNMDKLNVKSLITYGKYPDIHLIIIATVYTAFYVSLILLLGLAVFNNKEYV